MILKRPSFRRGGNSGIAMLRQRYQRGSDQSFLNPGAPKTIQDFYKDRAEKRQETSKGIEEFLKVKPRQPGTYRGYEVPKQPSPVVNENVDVNVDMRGDPAQFTGGVDLVTDFEALEREAPKPKVETVESSITLDPKAEIEKEAEFIKDLLKNENLTRGENALILAKAVGTPGSISEKISKAADLALPVIRKRDKQDKAITLKAYELFKKKEAEQGKKTASQKDIEATADALIKMGDKRPRAEIIADIRIKAAGFDREGKSLLAKGGGEVFEITEDIRKQRDKLTIAQGKNNQKDIEKINKKIKELQARLRTIASVPGFDDIFVGIRKEYLAEGGRIGYAEGTTEEEVKITETVADTPGAPTPERQVLKLSYAELRNKLPKEISDDIVELLANSTEALQDFAYITTQDDVSNFNVKYGVNLVIPQNA